MIDCKTTGLNQGYTNISHSPSLCIQEIFQGGCLTDDVTKPLALVISSTMNMNGWFSFSEQTNHDFLATLAKTHTVCHHYIQDSSEFSNLIKQFVQKKQIDVLVMRAHGGILTQKYTKELISPYSPHKFFAAMMSSLTPDATIILDSCLNAATCGKDDFAGFIHSMAPPLATVYAATQEAGRTELQNVTPPTFRMYNLAMIDITYRSGANGYCNNPLNLYDIQVHKLEDFIELVMQDRGFEAAISAATEACKSTDVSIRGYAHALFRTLFYKEQGYEAAISAAIEAFKSTNLSIRYDAIRLFNTLFDKGQGFKVARSCLSCYFFIKTMRPLIKIDDSFNCF